MTRQLVDQGHDDDFEKVSKSIGQVKIDRFAVLTFHLT